MYPVGFYSLGENGTSLEAIELRETIPPGTYPFPLNLALSSRIAISALLAANLIVGLKLRLIILNYMRAPGNNVGSINYLIWMDQLNGVFAFFSISAKLAAFMLPVPVASFTGDRMCVVIDYAGRLYLSGASTWSAYIGLYRVLYIKAQSWLKYSIGEKKLLVIFLVSGTLVVNILSTILVVFDDESVGVKTCKRLTEEDWAILYGNTGTPNSEQKTRKLKTLMRVLVGSVGIVLTLIEICSYIVYFQHVFRHDNTVAIRIVEQEVIKKRNRRNAISMVGQLAGWLMEVWHLVLIGFLTPIFNLDSLRNVSSLLKNFEFFLIPLVQILSSAPIKRYMVRNSISPSP